MFVEYPEGGTQAPHSSFHGFFYLVFLGKTMSRQTGKLQASFADPCQKCSKGSWKETQASLISSYVWLRMRLICPWALTPKGALLPTPDVWETPHPSQSLLTDVLDTFGQALALP